MSCSSIKNKTFLFCLLIFFCSCQESKKYPHTIKDFKSPLQPHLQEIVSNGLVTYGNAWEQLKKQASDQELMMLSKSEHPLLRATALTQLLDRPSINHYDLLMHHLDDTAIVAVDYGEFGVHFRKVSDEVIVNSIWKDSALWRKSLDEVLTKHPSLRSAHTILDEIEPNEKYYTNIKRMASKITDPYTPSLDIDFHVLEYALYGLAKFKKNEDVQLIKKQLMENNWQLSFVSFKLMKEFPNDVYLEVFEKYAKDYFDDKVYDQKIDEVTNFIESVAVYKNERSAKILQTLLRKDFRRFTLADFDYVKTDLKLEIWNNKCAAYSQLLSQVKPFIMDRERKYPKSDFLIVESKPVGTENGQKIYWR